MPVLEGMCHKLLLTWYHLPNSGLLKSELDELEKKLLEKRLRSFTFHNSSDHGIEIDAEAGEFSHI